VVPPLGAPPAVVVVAISAAYSELTQKWIKELVRNDLIWYCIGTKRADVRKGQGSALPGGAHARGRKGGVWSRRGWVPETAAYRPDARPDDPVRWLDRLALDTRACFARRSPRCQVGRSARSSTAATPGVELAAPADAGWLALAPAADRDDPEKTPDRDVGLGGRRGRPRRRALRSGWGLLPRPRRGEAQTSVKITIRRKRVRIYGSL
jgi:hypothetical protein